MVTGEISSIYKRGGKVRKVHSLVLLPSLEAAGRLNARLAQIGNILSDGRPILGLDPRDLLTMLSRPTARRAHPGHIWTPWFSMLGAKSGFDSLEECFGDLTRTSSPWRQPLLRRAMNHRIRCLDQVALVSNSDLHSPANLGRNANRFFGEPSYDAMLGGLRSRDPAVCGGTVDLFPEEGKYHLDGHRSCGVRLEPDESMSRANLCPACGKPLTIGVLHRVVELERVQRPGIGDQRSEAGGQASSAHELQSSSTSALFLAFPTLHRPASGAAGAAARRRAGLEEGRGRLRRGPRRRRPRAALLLDADDRRLESLGALGGMIRRVREGRVVRHGGYDGEYGTIRVA
jgi:PHP family Zn ribbon phosphoesterase